MIIGGLDLSLTSTGVAVLNGETVVTRVIKPPHKAKWLLRVNLLVENVCDILSVCDVIYLENYAFSARYSREAMGELCGILKRELLNRGHTIRLVSPMALKKFVTGKGAIPPRPEGVGEATWKKQCLVDYVERDYGRTFATSDELDAFILTKIGETTERAREYPWIMETLPIHQQQVIKKILKEEFKDGGKNNSKSRRRKQSKQRRRGYRKKSTGKQGS